MKVHLNLNERQLDVLLSQIEAVLAQELTTEKQVRGPELARAALKLPPNESSYDIAQLAPVYLQLVDGWNEPNTKAACVESSSFQHEWGVKHAL